MIVVLEGPLGSGKTLSAVALAVMEKNKSGKQIFSNIHLNGVDHTFFDSNDFISFMGGDSLINCSIIIDNAYIFMDSRNSQSSLNKLFSYLAMQSRPRNIDIYMTTQDIGLVDKRIRMIADARGRCKYNTDTRIGTITFTDLRTGLRKRVSIDLANYFDYVSYNEQINFMFENPIKRIVDNVNYNRVN